MSQNSLMREWSDANGVAAHLRISRRSVYRLTADGKIPVHRVGGLLRYDLHEVDRAVAA